jgi:membrane fusion protein (multidrug efflux system)
MNPTQLSPAEPRPQRLRLRWVWGKLPYVFLLLLLSSVILLFGRIKSEGEMIAAKKAERLLTEQPKTNIVALKLEPTSIRDRINLPGSTAAWIQLDIPAEVAGRVINKAIEDGVSVQKGALLAQIDPRDYKNAFHSANAAYFAAKSAYDRLSKLRQEQLTTRSQLDEAQALLEARRAAKDTAQLQLERCRITAPIAGVINRVMIENGQYLNVADPVAQILQLDRLKVRVGIPESDIDAVRKLDTFAVEIDALNGKTFAGTKHNLSRTADAMARLYMLELAVDNPEGEILPDMFTRVEIVKKKVEDALVVPFYAVITRDAGRMVFTVKDGKAIARPVTLGLLEGFRVQITKGLNPGEAVIVVGQRSVNAGQEVNVVRRINRIEDLIL